MSSMQDQSAAAGARASGDGQQSAEQGSEDEERSAAFEGPVLGTPFGGVRVSPTDPAFFLLVAVALASAALVGRGVTRAVR
jgi:hypothetical protein